MDMDFSIKTDDGQVFVSPFDDNVWVAIHGKRGSYRAVLTREQAKQMIDALQSVLGTREITE